MPTRIARLGAGTAAIVAVLALAATGALAAVTTHEFRLGPGPTNKVFTIHVTRSGKLRLLFDYHDVTNPNGHFVVRLKKAGWKTGQVQIDTATARCNGALGTIYCASSRAHTTTGWYNVVVTKSTHAPAQVGLKITTP
jgi:hypothetical protein